MQSAAPVRKAWATSLLPRWAMRTRGTAWFSVISCMSFPPRAGGSHVQQHQVGLGLGAPSVRGFRPGRAHFVAALAEGGFRCLPDGRVVGDHQDHVLVRCRFPVLFLGTHACPDPPGTAALGPPRSTCARFFPFRASCRIFPSGLTVAFFAGRLFGRRCLAYKKRPGSMPGPFSSGVVAALPGLQLQPRGEPPVSRH